MNNAKIQALKDAMAAVTALKAELDAGSAKERIQLSDDRTITVKISEKGGVSVYGIQRFPVTLFGNQWEVLLQAAPAILDYIGRNRDKLATKGKKDESEAA